MKRIGVGALVLASAICAYAQSPSKTRTHVETLASTRLEGRLAGSRGEQLAADYIAGELRKIGAKPLPGRTDLLEPFESPEFLGACDFLSCNPPYISTAKVKAMHPEISLFEPEAAFNGGVYGVSILGKLLRHAPRFLKPGGWLGFEVGLGQGDALVRQLGRSPAFSIVERFTDASGEVRAILARAKPLRAPE